MTHVVNNKNIWKGTSFPTDNPNVSLLQLPDGIVLQDACIWKNFMQTELEINPDDFFRNILKYPRWDDTKDIPFKPEGDDVHWIQGTHPSLNYRGNALKRNKIWCQRKYSKGMYKYGYTGWQHSISNATCSARKISEMKELMYKLDQGLEKKHNHWIVTEYQSNKDYIGFHADKDKDFDNDSYFIVLKLGAPRKFEFRLSKTKENPNPVPFFSEILSAGTAIFVGAKSNGCANSIVEHGVPPMDSKVGCSGSVVSRRIVTRIPWNKVQQNIENAKKDKLKRNLKKAVTNKNGL